MTTVNIDWGTLATLGTLLLAIVAGVFWAGKLSGRVDRLEQDVKEIKADIKRIYELMYRQMGPMTSDGMAETADD